VVQSFKHIVFFDGDCNLCNRSVSFVRKRDRNKIFSFVSLQSLEGQNHLSSLGLPLDDLSSVIYIENQRAFIRSEAGLRILKNLGWPWRILFILIIIPRPLRDVIYDQIAKYRYK
jgi:predicted DCC family thiol-disulfide oxidoreductase YuxK